MLDNERSFLVPLFFLSLIFTHWVFGVAFGLYLLAMLGMRVKITIQEKDMRYLIIHTYRLHG